GVTTLIDGDGPLQVGKGPVRTGVTAILPRGKSSHDPVMAGWFLLKGNGEMTGTTWVKESGFLEGPVFITNTHSVGVVRDAAIAWGLKHGAQLQPWSLPVVAETWDGALNDINGFHVKPEHVFAALDGARGGRVPEGNVGGGTGMICYQFKCGTGTASRTLDAQGGGYTVGVLVQGHHRRRGGYRGVVLGQPNHGRRGELRIAGVPVGAEIPMTPARAGGDQEVGSIIIRVGADAPLAPDHLARVAVVARDAALLPHQLERIARRATLGLARTGATSGNGSGDIFIAFSTANPKAAGAAGVASGQMGANDCISALFSATVQATEEAIVNALVAGETMRGIDDRLVTAL